MDAHRGMPNADALTYCQQQNCQMGQGLVSPGLHIFWWEGSHENKQITQRVLPTPDLGGTGTYCLTVYIFLTLYSHNSYFTECSLGKRGLSGAPDSGQQC